MPSVPTAASLGLGTGPAKIVPLQGRLQTQASPADFGAQQAQMIGAAAQDIGQAGATLFRAQKAVEERDTRVAANKFGLQARLDLTKWLEDAKQSAPAGAEGFTDTVMRHLEQYQAEHLEGVKSGLYRSLIEDDLGRFQISAFEEANAFQSQAKRAKAKTDVQAGWEAAQNLVYLKPEQYGDVLQGQIKFIEASGLSPEDKAQAAQDVTGALATSLWQRQVQDQPLQALAALRSGALPGLDFRARMALANQAEGELRRIDSERRQAAAEARMEARAARVEAREAARDARDAAEADLTAGILAGTAGPQDILKATQHRAISGDTARALTGFLKAQREPTPANDDDPLALQLMLRAGDGDETVIKDVADAVNHNRMKLSTARQVINDLQERQKSGGVQSREDVREGEASLRRVIEEAGPLGNITGDKAQKSLNAVRMYRQLVATHGEDPKFDPLDAADRVAKIWKNSFGDMPRSRFLVQAPGQPPDLAASIQRLQAAISSGSLSDLEIEIETEALERAAAVVQQKKGR